MPEYSISPKHLESNIQFRHCNNSPISCNKIWKLPNNLQTWIIQYAHCVETDINTCIHVSASIQIAFVLV